MPHSSGYAVPSTSKQVLPHEEELRKQAQAAKCFFDKEQSSSQVPTSAPLTPKMKGLKLSSLEPQAPSSQRTKCCMKQGPVKSSKN